MTKKTKRLIIQVNEAKNGQKRITIPKESKIKDQDYVKVEKLE